MYYHYFEFVDEETAKLRLLPFGLLNYDESGVAQFDTSRCIVREITHAIPPSYDSNGVMTDPGVALVPPILAVAVINATQLDAATVLADETTRKLACRAIIDTDDGSVVYSADPTADGSAYDPFGAVPASEGGDDSFPYDPVTPTVFPGVSGVTYNPAEI